MKFIVAFLFAIVVCDADLTDEDPTSNYREGDRFFYFPDNEGKLHLVDSLEPIDEDFIRSLSCADNEYILYTKFNPDSPQYLIMGDVNSVRNNSFFDPAKDTVFSAHGWNSNGFSKTSQIITEAFLLNNDVNVIQLDWSKLANQNYLTAQQGVPIVGRLLGDFIIWLTSLGLSYEKIHLVGFSLGGHLVGNTGRALQGKVRRITALDPAGPLWYFDSYRIVKTDGQYVEVIHTNTAFLGYKFPCGDADFYPNGGFLMPGCLENICSHIRSVEYFASSVKYNHLNANECDSFLEMMIDSCNGSLYPMGNSDLHKSRSGLFRVNTDTTIPTDF